MPSSTPVCAVDVAAGDGAGQPEVGDLDHAVLAQDDVLGLDVAVDQAGAVRRAERLQDRVEDVERRARGQRALGLHHLAQGVPGDELHREEHPALVLALVVDGDDVGVAEPGGRPGLAAEPADEGLVGGEARAHDLQRHLAVEPLVEGDVDRGHAAVGDVRQHAVPAGRAPGRRGWAWTAADTRYESTRGAPARSPGGATAARRPAALLHPGLERQHVAHVRLGVGVHPVRLHARQALVVAGDGLLLAWPRRGSASAG